MCFTKQKMDSLAGVCSTMAVPVAISELDEIRNAAILYYQSEKTLRGSSPRNVQRFQEICATSKAAYESIVEDYILPYRDAADGGLEIAKQQMSDIDNNAFYEVYGYEKPINPELAVPIPQN